MRERIRTIILLSALLLMIGAIFLAGKPELSFAQGDVFELYYLYVHCGSKELPAAEFVHRVQEGGTVGRPVAGTEVICVGNCAFGTFTLADKLAKLPAPVRVALQAQVDKHAVGKDWFRACLGDKPPNCVERVEKDGDLPWFDPSAPGCNDLHDTQLTTTFSRGKCTYTLRACGSLVLRDTIDAPNAASCTREYRAEQYGIAPLPQKVCCDIWREAAGAGSGCNPEVDADCDGEPNNKTSQLRLQYPYYAPRPGGNDKNFNPADFDPLPPGLDWEEVMPNEPCKGCKWMATSAKLTCSPDKYKKMPESRKRDHEYKATWKCPTSGVQRVVTKRVAAKFPCTPPKRPTPTASAFRPTLLQIFGPGLFTDPIMAVLPGFWTKPCVGSQLDSNLRALFKIEED